MRSWCIQHPRLCQLGALTREIFFEKAGGGIKVNGHFVKVNHEINPAKIRWARLIFFRKQQADSPMTARPLRQLLTGTPGPQVMGRRGTAP